MSLTIHRFDPTPCGFPSPRVPLLPALSTDDLLAAMGAPPFASPFCRAGNAFHTRGRYALHDAFRRSGVAPGTAVLLPAYHCRTMLDPAIRLGAEILLYPLRPDLSPDLDALAACLASASRPVRALLLTHYFGFPQAVAAIAAWCAARNIVLIEDCAHALLSGGEGGGAEIGTHGRYAVASPYKFVAAGDGGVLLDNGDAGTGSGGDATLGAGLRPQGLLREGRALLRALLAGRRQRRQRIGPAALAALPNEFAALQRRALLPADEDLQPVSGPSSHYLADEERRAGLALSHRLLRHCARDAVAARRRENYRAWSAAAAALPNCRVVFPELPASCVPYAFPLYLERPFPDFHRLKHLGVPIWRWDEMAASSCPVAADYRLRVLHLPCHQGLHADELAWMIAAVALVVRADASPAQGEQA